MRVPAGPRATVGPYDGVLFSFCTLCLACCAEPATSSFAETASSLTVSTPSVAVFFTDWTASWAGPCRFSLAPPAASFSGWLSVSECSLTWSFTVLAACCSFSVAGSSDEASHPTPKAIRPAANGLPWVFWTALEGAEVAVSPTVEATEDARSPALLRTPPEEWLPPAPMTLSFSEPNLPLARSTRRSTTRDGVTFSVSASTSRLRSARVDSMSRRITSGSSLVRTSVRTSVMPSFW